MDAPAAVAGPIDEPRQQATAPTEPGQQGRKVQIPDRLRPALPWIAATVVVVIIILIIRALAASPNAGELTPPTGTHTTTTLTPSVTTTVPGATALSTYSTAMGDANVVATDALGRDGNTMTVAQLDDIVYPYTTAVKVYNYQLHFVTFPADTQAAVRSEFAQLTSYIAFLETIGSVNQNNLTVWVSQLRSAGATTQVLDNTLRNELGLPSSNTFP
jgi:hypothetical protein